MMAAGKMSCRELVELIGAYHDGELSSGQHSAVAAHLAQCTKCRAYLNSYEVMVGLARAAMKGGAQQVSDTVPEDLVKTILAQRGRRK